MDSNYLRDREHRNAMESKCESYQRRLFRQIRNISVHTVQNPFMSSYQIVYACLGMVEFYIDKFQKERAWGVYQYCSVIERQLFIKNLMNEFENADYSRMIRSLHSHEKEVCKNKYDKIKQKMMYLGDYYIGTDLDDGPA